MPVQAIPLALISSLYPLGLAAILVLAVPKLQAVNAWLNRNGHTLLVAVVGAIGLWGFVDGLVGLLS
jgi:hypothetical protein